jgi:hypothetical protein
VRVGVKGYFLNKQKRLWIISIAFFKLDLLMKRQKTKKAMGARKPPMALFHFK